MGRPRSLPPTSAFPILFLHLLFKRLASSLFSLSLLGVAGEQIRRCDRLL